MERDPAGTDTTSQVPDRESHIVPVTQSDDFAAFMGIDRMDLD